VIALAAFAAPAAFVHAARGSRTWSGPPVSEFGRSVPCRPKHPEQLRPREVLDWCRHAHQKMGSDLTVPDWVLIWAGTIALLRAVGHVLDKEDAKSDARLKKAQSDWWTGLNNTKPDPSIFWQFIEEDRNLLLKKAKLTVEQSVTFTLSLSGGTIPRHAPQPPPPPIYTYQMTSDHHFAGQDPRDLVRNAIKWWEEQLDYIEQKAAASSP
jgi:hypothetical protein